MELDVRLGRWSWLLLLLLLLLVLVLVLLLLLLFWLGLLWWGECSQNRQSLVEI